MKMIFNKDQNGQEEIHKAIGFIDADVSYENLDRYLKSAVRSLYLVIGKPTYEIIQSYYIKPAPTDEETEFVEAVQDCLTLDAYRGYIPSKDVGHTSNGRRLRVDDHEKPAFQWMIDSDNENLERLYYKALDQLLSLLEDLPSWKNTDQYKKLTALFVSTTNDFQDHFDINSSRLLLQKLTPGLRQCERQGIIPRLGKEAFQELKADPTANEELSNLVKEACVYWALSWAMKGRLTVTLFPEGVLQRFVSERTTTQGKKPAAMNENAWAAQEFKNDAQDALLLIEQLLTSEEAIEDTDGKVDQIGYDFDEDDNYIST